MKGRKMGRFLERYQLGEYERVWDELMSLEDQIQEEPLFDDALAVAYETMRRVRKNIEMLIPRLCAIGYQFGYGWVQPFLGKQLQRQTFNGMDAKGELSFDFTNRRIYTDMLEMAEECPPLFLPANENEERALYLEQVIQALHDPTSNHANSLRRKQAEYQKAPDAKALVQRLEKTTGQLPLSVRAWYEVVGGVNFVGHHQGWSMMIAESVANLENSVFDSGGYYLHPLAGTDPLFLSPLTEERITLIEQYKQPTSQRKHSYFGLWPDEAAKYLDPVREYAEITLPCSTIDAMLQGAWNGLTFVQYLRHCFQWGGFPGWQKQKVYPQEDRELLIAGLLPF